MTMRFLSEMEKRELYNKYLEEKGAGAIELDKAVKKSFEDLYIPMAEIKNANMTITEKKVYVISLETSIIKSDNNDNEHEYKNFSVIACRDSKETAEQYIKERLDLVEKEREVNPEIYQGYTRHKQSCSYLTCYQPPNWDYILIEHVFVNFDITELEI